MSEQTIQSHDIQIADLFQSFYAVPDYQREFVWETEQVEQLLTDIHGELARLLSERPPPSEVELVAYANEEPPFFGTPHMGSAVHARSLRDAGHAPEAMICLEMIGYFTPRQPWPSLLHRLLYRDRGDFIGIVGRLDGRGAHCRSPRVRRPRLAWIRPWPGWLEGSR